MNYLLEYSKYEIRILMHLKLYNSTLPYTESIAPLAKLSKYTEVLVNLCTQQCRSAGTAASLPRAALRRGASWLRGAPPSGSYCCSPAPRSCAGVRPTICYAIGDSCSIRYHMHRQLLGQDSPAQLHRRFGLCFALDC